jgi:DNA-binding transcriptional LysR family regulator
MIDALTAFLDVVATGNFSKAARVQNVAVSSDDVAAGRLIPLFSGELRLPTASAIHAVRMPGRSSMKAKLFVEHLRASFGVSRGGLPYWDKPFEPQIHSKP